MEVSEAIRNRRSIRSFKSDPVPKKVLEEILDTCRWAPSSSNTQPWEFVVLGGKPLEELNGQLIEKVKKSWDSSTLKFSNINPDVPIPELVEPYLQRAMTARAKIDSHQFPTGTKGLDEKRVGYILNGARFYNAPNAIILCLDRSLYPKMLLDIGLMAQTIALAACGRGLSTCIMAMPLYWPEIVREVIGIPESKLLVLALAIGYAANEALVNNFERAREPIKVFTRWYGI